MNTPIQFKKITPLVLIALALANFGLLRPLQADPADTFYGGFSGYNTNTALGTSDSAFGYSALYGNVSGSHNTAIGAWSLEFSTGENNTAIGTQALQNNSTGSNNIALGNFAGINLSTGNNNIDIYNSGVAGESNTIRIGTGGTQMATYIAGINGLDETYSGGSPVFILPNGRLGTGVVGAFANSNTIVGDGPSPGGNSNTTIGYYAFIYNYTGNGNTGVGATALSVNFSGSGNTAMGTGAMNSNTTGNNNIAVGNAAGDGIVAGNNNIDIGNGGADESNTIRIGDQAVQHATFIAGINGVDKSAGNPVFIDANGQLGTGTALGPPGPQGPQGPAGDTGPQGAMGPAGPTGQTGPQGATGPVGQTGATGVIGPQGPVGLTGATGAQGPQGPIGATGATGLQGPIGLGLTTGAIVQLIQGLPAPAGGFTKIGTASFAYRDLTNHNRTINVDVYQKN
jgi:hypothetical protein